MCFECFDVLYAHIAGPPGAVPPPPRYADHTWYVARPDAISVHRPSQHTHAHTHTSALCVPRYSPFFVTWETSRESILRGCIGTLSPRRLRGGLAEYALLAGTRDSRFPPVTGVAELERLAVKISLLHSYETLPTRGDDV